MEVGVVHLVVSDSRLRTTTKKKVKRSSTFFRKKVHLRQNPGYAYVAERCKLIDRK